MATNTRLITTGEAATILGLSASTVRRLIDLQKLPVVGKISGETGMYLLDEGDVRAYKKKQAKKSHEA